MHIQHRTRRDGDCGIQATYDRPGGDVDLAYFLNSQGGNTQASFAVGDEGGETVFGDGACGSGDAECVLYEDGTNGDYYLVVRDFGQDNWSTDQANCYSFTLLSAAGFGCPVGCSDAHPVSGNCFCQ